jgi:serine/threonine-protein kinase
LLRELILLEMALRGRAGEQPRPEDYRDRFPSVDLESPAPASTEPDPAVNGAPTAAPRAAHGCEVLEEIGRGGIGVVHRGRDAGLRRELAVKVLRDEHRDNADLVRRFLEEAQIGGQLQHPGVVPVYELGEFPDRRPYFTMKLVRGETLADLLGRRKAPGDDLPRLVAIFEQVCQTLAYAHAHGVLHRDLKPQNVMVGAFGEVQVMDWGLAKVLASRGRQPPDQDGPTTAERTTVIETDRRDAPEAASQHGAVMGTFAYMPPEQARGEVDRLDARCDVFGLGAVLCEILTGAPPYRGTREEVRGKAKAGDLQDAAVRLDGCGAEAELVRLAKDCLAAEQEGRPGDAGAVARAVTAYLAGVQERLRTAELERAAAQAREAEAKAKAAAERRARRLTVGLAASVVLTLVLLGVGGGWWLWRQAQTEAAVESDLGAATTAALRGDDQAAREALERAQGRLAGGGFDALRQRVEALQSELDFVAELEEARMKALETTKESNHLNWAEADAAFAKAFADRALDVTGPGADAALERIGRWPVKARIMTALDAWADVKRQARVAGWQGLLEAAGQIDDSGDMALRQLRDAVLRNDMRRLKEFADDPGIADWPPADAVLLAYALVAEGEQEAAVRVLRASQARNAGDFWLNEALGTLLAISSPSHRDEGIGFLRAAAAARPRAVYAHYYLGVILVAQGKPAEAEKEYREFLRLNPDFAWARYYLGVVLENQNKLAEAEKEFREVIRLNPDLAWVHHLCDLLKAQGKLAEAEEEYREVIRLNPDDPGAHTNLGAFLRDQGRFREALDELRRGHELGSRTPNWRYPSGQWVKQCERLVELDALLPAVLRGTASPAGAPEMMELARFAAHRRNRFRAAAGLIADCLASRPDWSQYASDRPPLVENHPPYYAAAAAVMAARGEGDGAGLGAEEGARLRKQALGWLRDHLAFCDAYAAAGQEKERNAVKEQLAYARTDGWFSTVRDADALAKLPEAERDDWRKLWADVDAALQPAPPPKPPLKVEDALEGEKLKIVGKSSDFPLGPQDLKGFDEGRWSGDAHLWGRPPKAGEWADLEVPVAADGNYKVIVYLTKARDYGIIQFSLDGKPLGKPIDGFEPDKVVASGPVDLGTVELKKGTAVLRIEVTGTNEKSVGLRYMWGLDCVVLEPEMPVRP